ncbi:hypothetical protein [Streptomyces sp. NPDC097981]|uniref:hypothetical protein n=1 Tax=Streptomyces sp. NPDC097981 TaxID=3155428 RepID=UPI00331F5584
MALVEQVMTTEPYASAKRVFWVVDNGSSHRGQRAIDRLASRFPNAVMVHTPIHASWTNQLEILFSIVQRKVVQPNDFTDLTQVRDRLRAFEDRCNATAQPFQWRFTTSDLNDLLARLDRHTPADRQEESSVALGSLINPRRTSRVDHLAGSNWPALRAGTITTATALIRRTRHKPLAWQAPVPRACLSPGQCGERGWPPKWVGGGVFCTTLRGIVPQTAHDLSDGSIALQRPVCVVHATAWRGELGIIEMSWPGQRSAVSHRVWLRRLVECCAVAVILDNTIGDTASQRCNPSVPESIRNQE